MAIDLTVWAADVAAIEADLPQSVTLGGVDYAAIVGDVSQPLALGEEGFYGAASFPVLIRRALFTAAGKPIPVPGDLLTYAGSVYRVASAAPSQDGVTVSLTCEAEAQQ